MPPLISVILPTYDRRPLLARSIASILNQTFTNYELVIIDDKSTDDTATWLSTHHPHLNLITLPQHQGASAARNHGIRQTQGQYIAFLDSDDTWAPTYLTQQLQSLQAHPAAILSYTKHLETIEKSGQVNPIDTHPLDANDLIISLLLGNFISTLSQVMIPRWAIERVGLFDERLSVCHDRELYLRLFAIGQPVHINEALVTKYWQPDSLVTADRCESWLQSGIQLLDIFYSNPGNAPYLYLRSIAEWNFRRKVDHVRQYFSQQFKPG